MASTDQTSEAEKVLQQRCYEDIIAALVAAGYFRAEVSGLSEFDKVVGGLCWCITVSGEDVDVDVLFQENTTIGQRIALTEAIVTALRKMGCRIPLQAHQIQGGVGGADFAAILPVVQWLIKKGAEWRAEHATQLRAFSALQFTKHYPLPADGAVDDGDLPALAGIATNQKAVRQYRRRAERNETEEKRVLACLLEFGESFSAGGASGGGSGGAADSSKIVLSLAEGDISLDGLTRLGGAGTGGDAGAFEKKLAQAAKDALKEEEAMAERAAQQQEELLGQMRQVVGGEMDSVSGSQLGAVVSLGAGEIGTAAAAYQAQLDDLRRLMDGAAGGRAGQAAAYKRQKEALLKHRDDVDAKLTELKALAGSAMAQLGVVDEERTSTAEYNAQLKQQIVKLHDLEVALACQEDVAMLKHLVALQGSLQAQETAFKASCQGQLNDLRAAADAMDAADDAADESRKLRDIEETHAAVAAKYAKLRQALAETNRALASSTRIIDDVPSRIELIQYERRFAELYQQVAWKLEETKKYYAAYNALDTTLNFLRKEVKLLNSISETFPAAMKSSSTKVPCLPSHGYD